jgi:hypothetical protein
MYYDLNVPWTTNTAEIQNRLSFLAECAFTICSRSLLTSESVGYNVVAISHTLPLPAPTDLVRMSSAQF